MGNRREFLTVTAAGLAAAAAPSGPPEERDAAPKAMAAGVPAVGMPRDMMLINMRRDGRLRAWG